MLLVNRRERENVEVGEHIDRMGTNIYSSKDNESLHKSLNSEFIFYQILFDEILDENKPLKHLDLNISKYFKPDNTNDQQIMDEFDNKYESKEAIHWYTRDTCIYRILNKALRTQNIDDITVLSQFVRDLYQQLKQEQQTFTKDQKSSIIIVYRGQFISKDELIRLKSTKGELISVNSFLSTSKSKKKALEFATGQPPPNDELTSILLEIFVNIRSPTRPLADIKHLSQFTDEEEILFMFGCVFRIDDVWFDEDQQIWNARFTLCAEADYDMKTFVSLLDQQLNGLNKFISLGNYFIQMQKYEQAQEHYEHIIKNKLTKDEIELAYSYYGLSQVYNKKNYYDQAITNIQIALDYLAKNCPTNDHELISQSYNDLGSIYTKQKDYIMAIQSYEKALQTKNNVTSNTYFGLSQIQFKLNNFILAQEYLQKSLDNQPEIAYASIANIYIHMGKVYIAINEKDKASQMFDKAIESQLKVVNSDHPDLSYTYTAIGLMYSDINDEQNAFQYIEKAHQLQSEYLPNNHPDFAQTYTNFGNLYMKKEDFDQALSYYHKALENQLKTLLWNHPAVAETYKTIGSVHWKKKDYEEALIYFHKVLDSDLSRKKFGDPSLSNIFKNIADLYFEKDDLDQSLIFYLKYLENELEMKLYEDISLVDSYEMIAKIYYKKRQLSESLLYYNRSIDCYLRKQPLDQTSIQQLYFLIGKVYLKKHDFNNTLLFYEKSQKLSKEKITIKEESNDKLSKNEYRNIDNIHFERRHLDQAFNYFEKYLNEQLKTCSETDPLIGDTYQILANIYFEKGDFDQSLNYFIKLLNNKLKRQKLDDSSLSNIYKAIGTIYFEKNLLSEALIYFNRFIDCRFKKKKSFEESSVIEGYNLVGKVYLVKHDFNETSNNINKSIENSLTTKNKTQKSNVTDYQFEKRHLETALFYFHNLLDKQIKNPSSNFFSLEYLYIIIANLFLEKQLFYRSLTYFQQSFNYQLKKNPQGNLLLLNTYAVIGNIHVKLGNFDEALQNYRQSRFICQRIDPTNHSLIQKLNNRIREIIIPNI